MAVPLLNWSKSIRDLSLDKGDQKGQHSFSAARTIIVYWGFLVVTGLVSILVLIEASDPTKLGYSTLIETKTDEMVACAKLDAGSANSTFPPPLLASYYRTNNSLVGPIIDFDWAQEHHCSNPCASMATNKGLAAFRQADDYQLASLRSLIKVFEVPKHATQQDRLAADFQYFVERWAIFVLPYVISQGIWATAFDDAAQHRREMPFISSFETGQSADPAIPLPGSYQITLIANCSRRFWLCVPILGRCS
jgi:hypothetical protein